MSSEVEENLQNTATMGESASIDWDRYIDFNDVFGEYDTVIEIYSNKPAFYPGENLLEDHRTDYIGINDEMFDEGVIEPGWDYESPGNSIKRIKERLEGKSVVVAFGYDGENLPHYSDLNGGLDSRGNWWDHPELVPADFLLDEDTYKGAFRAPRSADVASHVFRNNSDMTDVRHISQSNP